MVNSNNCFRFGKNQLIISFFLFLGLNIVVYSLSPPDSFIAQDTKGYLEPAQLLINQDIYRSDIRLPGYPILLAGILLITDNLGLVTVLLQIGFAFATGLLAGLLAERIRKDTGLLTLLFACFNPVTLLYVQSILSDLLFSFLFVAHLFFLVKVFDKLSIWPAIATGVFAGLAAVVRGNGQFLILVSPILMWLAYRTYNHQFAWKKLVLVTIISLLSSVPIVTPWLNWNMKNGNGLSFSSIFYRNYVIHENVIAAVVNCKRITLGEAKQIVYKKFDFENSPNIAWNSIEKKNLYALMAQTPLNIMGETCGVQIIPSMFKTLATFFVSSSGRSWAQMFQLDVDQRLEVNLGEDLSKYSLTAVVRGEPCVSKITIFWHVFSIGIIILVRIFNLIGLYYIVRKKQWYLLIPLLVYTTIFAGTAGFIGYSRFRLPLSPLLAILASLGAFEVLSQTKNSNKHKT